MRKLRKRERGRAKEAGLGARGKREDWGKNCLEEN